jgi:hypothetical protein
MDSGIDYIRLINFLEENWAMFVAYFGGESEAEAVINGLKEDAGLQ